jgi:hypothetical protein
MDKLSSAIKCGNCKHVLDSPVLLPCGDSICKKHTIESKEPILCYTCGVEHPIPANGGFLPNNGLSLMIEAQIASLNFGKEHKEAKQSCQNFQDLVTKIENFISDPYNFTYEAIEYLKNVVQLKGEEEMLKITQSMHRIINKLDEYKIECKKSFTNSENTSKIANFTVEKEKACKENEKWLAKLNELTIDWREYERIKSESEKAIESFEKKLMEIKVNFFPKRFDEFRVEIEKDFGSFDIDPLFDLR